MLLGQKDVATAKKNAADSYIPAPAGTQPHTPMWDGQFTKRERTMSDEEFEKAIKQMALEYAEKATQTGNSGKSKSMINNELYNLNREFEEKRAKLEVPYVSVVSPDRKAAFAAADFTKDSSIYGNEINAFGGYDLMTWGPSGWSTTPTPAEVERMKKFANIYIDTLREYETEHGQIPYTTISKAVAPVRNYL
jgi:hypothetical protein